ncbi:MAG TPA: hypothetical protein VF066_07265 [Thermoleophilaceae bacterium]
MSDFTYEEVEHFSRQQTAERLRDGRRGTVAALAPRLFVFARGVPG